MKCDSSVTGQKPDKQLLWQLENAFNTCQRENSRHGSAVLTAPRLQLRVQRRLVSAEAEAERQARGKTLRKTKLNFGFAVISLLSNMQNER